MKRKCRQRNPISPFFIPAMCGNFANYVNKFNFLIKGIVVNDKKIKLPQYACDTALALDGTQHSLKSALSPVDQFAKFSGLRPNFD